MSRRKAREVAFQMLFQMSEGANEREMAELTLAEAELSAKAARFAAEISHGAWEKRFEIAEYIKKFISGWQLERLFSVDRELLHLAIYELRYCEEPAPVIINEAVELAKIYGSDESPAFINAVLDNFVKKVLVEKLPEYEPDLVAIEEARAAEVLRLAKFKPEPDDEEGPKPAPLMPITKKMEKKGFRKIAKAEQTADDVILPEPEEEEGEFGRPYERRSFERRDGGRSFGDRKSDDKKLGDRKYADRKFGDKKPYAKREGEKSFGDRKFGDRKSYDKKPYEKKRFNKDEK